MENKEFHYAYSAPTEEERKHIESIRRQYQTATPQETKMERLKSLHAQVKNGAVCISLVLGVVGILIFGTGLTMVLEWQLWVWGCIVAAIGVIPTALAYPVYKVVLKGNKKKHGKEILQLSEELLKGQD